MNVKFRKHVLVGVTAVTALGLVIAPVTAASAAPLNNGSLFPIYFVDADSELEIPEGQVLQWESVVSAVSNLESPYDRFPASPDATGVKYFISAPGDELNQAQWYGTQSGSIDTADQTNGLSYMPLEIFADGDRPGDISDVKTLGGEFSMGFVYTSENGNQIASGKGAWFDITVAPGGSWTFEVPVPVQGAEAPVVTTQPANVTVDEGATATFTAVATGSDSVKWQSSTNGTDWADIAGATSASYTTPATTLADTNKQFRAVFTNATGSTNSGAATLVVNDLVDPVVEPTDADNAGTKKDIAAPAEGASSITLPAGVANADKQNLKVVLWPGAVNRAPVDTTATGDAVIDLAGLAAGSYKVALVDNDNTVLAWGTFAVTVAYPDQTAEVDLNAQVRASDLWSLSGVATSVDFGEVRRGAESVKPLNGIKVVDDRNALEGWTLSAAWTAFTSGADTIPADALTIATTPGAGSTLIPGITVGTGAQLAQSDAGISTLEAGQLFDTALTFKAPKDAKVGDYNSTLTLTLASK